MLTWGYWRGRDISYKGKYIVHGHDSNPQGPFIGTNRCNIDVRSFITNRLCVAVFDGPGKPKEIMEIKI
jgi:serine/threonine protein phosphatase 1